MGDIGNLQVGDIKKKKENINKTAGINTERALFQTGNDNAEMDNPYAMSNRMPMTRVEEFANRGPLMATRIHTQNPNDLAFEKKMEREKEARQAGEKVRSEEDQTLIRAQPDLKVFSGEVMEKGAFTVKAKEAARHFYMQLEQWAGSFDDGGSGFYREMGINNVMDCLYVDGMSLRSYLREQYWYKTTGKPATDKEALRNYVALLVARGDHLITLVRPNVKGDEAEVEYKNLSVDLTNVGEAEAEKSRKLKEKGGQMRSNLKKRLDAEMTERTGMAFRKCYGYEQDGFNRIEGAKRGMSRAKDEKSEEYQSFSQSFDKYNNGLQKLGLKPGRDDINLPVAEKLRERCADAIKAADAFLTSGSQNAAAVKAVMEAKRTLETDLKLLDQAISNRLDEEGRTMRLEDLLDSRNLDHPDNGRDRDNDDNDPFNDRDNNE